VPLRLLISDFVFPVVENNFSGNRDPLTHRIYRVASFVRQLAELDDFVDGRGALDFEKIGYTLRGFGKIFDRELAGQIVGHAQIHF
jgi:hypothetical protein